MRCSRTGKRRLFLPLPPPSGLLQGNKASDAGSIITGGNENLFGHQKERGLELVVTRLTMILGILFFVISLVLFLK